ncbi:uncharacterized protein BO80DRAFT_449746 [Aspergillus ibericus CBS 121593]|uniref:Uncharacterized protein n=1 Tax=Aspergillus ibericus CBS 121593 TaxID=1448316 RepID=A0A395GK67_9EURO|nr:hypothetical protein BO80DRAFT_449746 [Aspergillus ibericus CBS 121593]RAK95880.1 hypothetical protein BO80DRAFT_449746 [Aspergillus ibericus CBS 121593]
MGENGAQKKDASQRQFHDLSPPQLHWIVADSDALQPSKQQLEDALEKSRLYWYSIASVACNYRDHGVKQESANPHHMLWKVPRMHGGPHTTYAIYMGACPCQLLFFRASVSWQLDGSTDCDRVQRHKSNPVLLQLGTKAPVPYTLSGNGFRQWMGTEDEVAVGPNYLAILTLGWCYILSARLLEIQGRGGMMEYTTSKAAVYDQAAHETAKHVIDIGEADDDTISWWLAILAPSNGWKGIVKQCDDGDFLAPWSITRTSQQSLAIKWQRKTATPNFSPTPMSSSRAFDALSRFALMHNLGSQFHVALATAITVPTHNCHGSTIQLPEPTLTGARCSATPAKFMPPEWVRLYQNLPYYITLSCNPETIISSLCGAFWEPGVPCNLVSPWLHPILIEVPEEKRIADLPGLYAELLAIVCGIRRPTISALWLGAVAGGLAPIILRRAKRGRPPLDPVAFPWTGSPQSFMDIAGTGPYFHGQRNEKIWRADVWRLLHLPTTEEDDLSYNYPPRTPWEPCGKMEARDCALRVASHWNCPRHQLHYQHWSWEPENSPAIYDKGFSTRRVTMPTTPDIDRFRSEGVQQFPHRPLDQEASEEASLDIFHWLIISGEGFPPGELYKDAWLEGIADDVESDEEEQEEDGNMSSDTPRAEKCNGLEQWLDTLQ